MPDPDYKGEFPTEEEVQKANEEQAKFVEDNPENFSQLQGTSTDDAAIAEGREDSPTPAADLGEGGLVAQSGDGLGPTGSSDPDKLAERQENVAETGSTVSEEEVADADKDDDKDDKPAAKKPAAKKPAADKK
jgi:hypothetical protein